MPRTVRYKSRMDLMQGTLDLIILQTLRRGPQHGYGISQAINAASREAFKAETGTLYPALVRLEQKGWIKGRWDTTEHNREAKFYGITAAGTRALGGETARWRRLAGLVERLLGDEP